MPLRRGDTIGLLALQSYDRPALTAAREVLSFVAPGICHRAQAPPGQISTWPSDSLTGLSRRLLQERAQSLELAKRHHWSVAFLYLDLDRFKNVNDTLGHDAGDELLAEIAGVLKVWLRASDTVARLGGDEFAFVINDSDAERAMESAGRILALLDRPFVVRGQRIHLGASIGIALYPQHGNTIDELLKHADIAMYQAKVSGGSHAVYDPGRAFHGAAVARGRAVAGDRRRRLRLTSRCARARRLARRLRALARWRRDGQLVAASEFIPAG